MSTRSAIIRKVADGKYEGVYCHGDGYPSWNGRVLREHYNTPTKAAELIALGSLLGLAATMEATEAFHRDKGEDMAEVSPITGETAEAVADQIDHEYVYLFNGAWTCNGLSIPEAIEQELRRRGGEVAR